MFLDTNGFETVRVTSSVIRPRDMTEIAAQVPALIEALSGVPMADLLSRVRKIGDSKPAGV